MADIEKDADLDLDEEEQVEEDEDKSSDKKESDTEDNEEDEGGDKDDEEEIPVRKSANASFIIQRQKQTIDKLRNKRKEKDVDGEEEEDLTPESKTLIEREIDKHIAPIRETLISRADEEELKELFKSEPEAKQFEKTIKAYMQSPHYKSVPPSVIYHHLAFGEAENSGANRKRVADKEARMSRTKGNQKRPTRTSKGNMPSSEEIEDMDENEFESLQNDVRQGKYLSREE